MKFIVLTSPSKTPCGVEAFARQLSRSLDTDNEHDSVEMPVGGSKNDLSRLWAALKGSDALILNLPIVAWKRNLLFPFAALLMARLRGLRTVAVLHEWKDLNWLRRLSYFFYMMAVEKVVCSSPIVQREFSCTTGARLFPLKLSLIPVPPNLRRRLPLAETALSQKLKNFRAENCRIIGHFGSIYPKKQSILILDIVAGLRTRGIDAKLVFIGSFIKGVDRIQEDFRARIHALGLDDHVIITGYIEHDDEIFGLFNEVDAFAYQFAEGLTSRRGSVLATLQSGKPVLVNSPENRDEFDHHPSYRTLLAGGTLRLLPHEATTQDFIQALTLQDIGKDNRIEIDFDAAWHDAAQAIINVFARKRSRFSLKSLMKSTAER